MVEGQPGYAEKPDVKRIDPFTLTMPDNGYWRIGENVGKAWAIGKKVEG